LKWELATENQLLAIVNDDKNCPASLWSRAVVEMINRNLFDSLIGKVIHRVMNTGVVEQIHKMSFDDFLQIGRLEVWKLINRFNSQKGVKFTSFAYTAVKHEMIRQIEALETQKRDTRNVTSYQTKTLSGDEYEIFLSDKKIDVEQYVVNKITLEQLLKRVNKHQKTVLYYRLQGFTFEEISVILGRGSVTTMHQAYMNAIKKMRKGA
jgi:RNA polymerase sporulation-specific sigma factor